MRFHATETMPEERVARQFWIEEPGRGAIRSVPPSIREEGQVRIRTLYSGVSRGTESLVFRGEVPASQRESMRAPFQEGDFPGPVKYGYASVGRVVEGPGEGIVFCLHPHQDEYCVPADAVTPLPPGVPPERAILAANMETALNAVWDGRVAAGDRVTVVGGGVVGLLVARLCAGHPGTEVRVVDPNGSRADVCDAWDLAFSTKPPGAGDADVVFHASGNPSGLPDALPECGPEATVVEVSWFGDAPVTLPLGEAFHSRRLVLRSSQVGSLPPERRPRWDASRRLRLALELLRDPALDLLFTGESPFEELPDVLARLSRKPGDTLCHRIRYPESQETPCTA